MGKRFLSTSEWPPIKRQRRSRNIGLARDIDAEGDIFDDPCRPCRSKNTSCLVSPRSTRCATCVRAGHRYGSLAAVHARITSAETDLGCAINNSTEVLANLQKSQAQIYKLQLELDILRRRRARMRLSEPSSSPRGASSSPAF
ncbi:hypothetical protein V8E54_010521 [Elaphomyces granulatus]|jgi:hypothetical protein